VSNFQAREVPLTSAEKESIALAEENAMRALRQRASRWLQDDTFQPYSGRKELNTLKCSADCSENAGAVFRKIATVFKPHARSKEEVEFWLRDRVESICASVRDLARKIPAEDRDLFELEVPPKVADTLEAELETVLERMSVDEPERLRSAPVSERSVGEAGLSAGAAKPGQSCDHPGAPLFENPYPKEDLRHSVLCPCFEMLDEFKMLGQEYPGLSIDWKAASGTWLLWPPPYRAVGDGEGIPSSPGSDLHVQRAAGEAAERLLRFSGENAGEALRHWLNPGRDRWLRIDGLTPWEFWLYAIREFWLNGGEQAEAAGAQRTFEKVAEEEGYVPGGSTAIGGRVWSLMVTQHKSLREVFKEHRLSRGEEIDQSEEPAGWIQDGKIVRVFKASAYFCGVLAAQRVQELAESTRTGAVATVELPATSSFWEGLRLDFIKLRTECAINPPLAQGSRLSAIWTSQPEPGSWRLFYYPGSDSNGVGTRFQWHAQSAAARLGFGGGENAAFAYWLDQIRRDAPASHN
jgi:hypothetical protein